MSRSPVRHPSLDAWLLFSFVVVCFLVGGGSRGDTASLVILRPFAAVMLMIGLLRVRAWPAYGRLPLALMLAVTALIALQLVPLPPSLWTALPGREALTGVARAVGVTLGWHPLSLLPIRTSNALFSMLVPLAALVLMVGAGRQGMQGALPLLIVMVTLSAMLGLLQVIGPVNGALYFYRDTGDGFANGLFANRNHHAVVLACVFPMLAAMARLPNPDPRRVAAARWILGALALFFIAVILLTGSRAGFLLSGVGLIGAGWIIGLESKLRGAGRRDRRIRRHAPMVVGVGALIVLLIASVAVSRAPSIDRLIGSGIDGGRRLSAYPIILHMEHVYFLLGSGFGTFAEVFQIYEPDAMLAPTYLNQVHNDWLQVLLEGGVPAALLMVVALVGFVRVTRAVLARAPSSGQSALLGRVGALILLILGLASAVDYPARTPSVIVLAVIATMWMVSAAAEGPARR